MMRNVMRW